MIEIRSANHHVLSGFAQIGWKSKATQIVLCYDITVSNLEYWHNGGFWATSAPAQAPVNHLPSTPCRLLAGAVRRLQSMLFEGLRRRKGQERIVGIPRSFVIRVIGKPMISEWLFIWMIEPANLWINLLWFCCKEVRSSRVSGSRWFDKWRLDWWRNAACCILSHLVPTLLLPRTAH